MYAKITEFNNIHFILNKDYFKRHCQQSHAIKQYQQTFWNVLVWVEIFEHIHGKINLTIKIMNIINYGHIHMYLQFKWLETFFRKTMCIGML